ncbi:single-stranded DNA-binding protein [Vibrio hannami]|uniref:single-stranded DNA-binding protein n=1 Tax=Vibrio hannami TaxID=2717094 RepID=UPI0024103248|nr:single-stranded DNA-binding protein [Vibrio hannami]MDG3085468.1 single-stranded DNA-binding protein [Vibrio hannami]
MPKCLGDYGGYLYVNSQTPIEYCNGYIALTAADYNELMDYTQVTAEEITSYFSLGFALVFVGGYLMTFAIRAALQVVRLI